MLRRRGQWTFETDSKNTWGARLLYTYSSQQVPSYCTAQDARNVYIKHAQALQSAKSSSSSGGNGSRCFREPTVTTTVSRLQVVPSTGEAPKGISVGIGNFHYEAIQGFAHVPDLSPGYTACSCAALLQASLSYEMKGCSPKKTELYAIRSSPTFDITQQRVASTWPSFKQYPLLMDTHSLHKGSRTGVHL